MPTHKKIAWLTPFGPRSDIGAHSLSVVRAMRRRAAEFDCEIALFIKPNGPSYHAGAPRIVIGPHFDANLLSLYDVTVLNIGNNQENHGLINEMALMRGGVVVVHDIVMQHYIAWETLQRLHLPRRFADVLCKYYGARAVEMLARSGLTLKDQVTRYLPWESEHAFAFPLIEPFLEKAKAVVVHSDFASEIVARMSDAPQLKLFLPSDKKTTPLATPPPADGKVRFVSIGHYSRSKHLHLCLEAFLLSDVLRDRATLRIVGGGTADSDVARELLDIVREHGLQEVIKFEFNVTEQRLFEVKASADAFVNVRFPNIESASGSLAEQMSCGVPVIVYDSGCYREAPDEGVVKIADLSTSDALRAAMEMLVLDPVRRKTIGLAAREFGQTRTADDYAAKFLRFLHETDLDPGAAATAGSGNFAWLSGDVEAFNATRRGVPDIFSAEDRPVFRAIAELDAETVAQYLSLVVFRLTVPPDAMKAISEIVASLATERRATLVARLAFFNRLYETGAPALLSEIALACDAEAFLILGLIRPAAYVSLLYLGLLGRTPEEREVELHLPALELHGPSRLLRNFAESAEFAKRWTPRQFAESLETAAAAMDDLRGHDLEPARNVRLGDELGPSDLGALLMDGWHGLEPFGVWSCAPTARLRLRLGTGADRPKRLKLKLRALIPPNGEPQGVTASANGDGLRWLSIADGEPLMMDLTLDPGGESYVNVKLTIDCPVRLADYEPESDVRNLGLFLYSLTAAGA